MDLESCHGRMETTIKANLKMGSDMVRESELIVTVVFSLESIRKITQLGRVFTTGRMVKAITVSGRMGSFMDKESRRCQTGQYSTATG